VGTFVRDIAVFALIQAVIAGVLIAAYEPPAQHVHASTIVKHKRLEEAPSPRIIFLGGSGMLFGVDGKMVETETGYAPVNMGLNAGVGLHFMLREVEEDIRKGDIVVVTPEYEHFGRELVTEVLFTVLEHRAENLDYLESVQVPMLLDRAHIYFGQVARAGLRRLRGARVKPVSLPYCRDGVDGFGDMVGHRGLPSQDLSKLHMFIAPFDNGYIDDVVTRLNAFHDHCEQRGAQAVLAYPAAPSEKMLPHIDRIRSVAAAVREECRMPVLNTPATAAMPLAQFYDTVYHLGPAGARVRTERLLEWLKPYLDGM